MINPDRITATDALYLWKCGKDIDIKVTASMRDDGTRVLNIQDSQFDKPGPALAYLQRAAEMIAGPTERPWEVI